MKTWFCDVMFGWVSGGWFYSHFVLQLAWLVCMNGSEEANRNRQVR